MTETAIPAAIEAQDRVEAVSQGYVSAFPSRDADAFRAHLSIIMTAADLRQAGARLLAGLDSNPARYSLLRVLYFAPGRRLPQGEVARLMSVTSANVSQLIDALEREGLVERELSESDRRVTYARLTPDGAARCDELVPAMAAFMEETCEGLPAADLQRLADLLSKVRANLED